MRLKFSGIYSFTVIVITLALMNACAQQGQKEKLPAQPKPASVKEVIVDSQKHLLKPLGGDIIALTLFIKGGVANYTKNKAGIEPLSLKAAILGGARSNKNVWQKQLKASGIRFNTKTTRDYSTISVQAPKKEWNKAWKMLKNLIQHPAMDTNSLARAKSNLIQKATRRSEMPGHFIAGKSMAYAFENRDYAKFPIGDEKQLQHLERKDVLRYFKGMMSKQRLMAVAAGPLDSAKLAGQLKQLWIRLPDKEYELPGDSSLTINQSSVQYFDKAVETNYLRGFFMAPKAGTQELLAMKMGLSMLKDKLKKFDGGEHLVKKMTLRVKAMKNPFGIIGIKAGSPSDKADKMLKSIKRIKRIGFDSNRLDYKKKNFLTQYYLNRETAYQQSLGLGKAEIFRSWVNAETMEKRVKDLRVETVNQVLNNYLKGIQWYYLGDRSKIEEKVLLQPL